MPATQTTLSRPDLAELDHQIVEVEQRLIAREERLRRGLAALSGRVRRAAEPTRVLLPLGGAALGALLLWLWRGRRGGARGTGAMQSAASGQHRGSSAEAPWISLIALAWPLVPARWRRRISPATASTLVAIGLPLAQGLLGARRGPPPVAASQVDLSRYAGGWYEVARLPSHFEGPCAGQPQAEYTPRWDGSVEIVNRCPDKSGQTHEVRGIALPLEGGNGAKLRVSLWPLWLRWLPLAWSDYWILHVDEAYSEALVATPDRRHLWLLSRHPQLVPDRIQALEQMATMQGFVIAKLRLSQPA
jgi:apolipoprotein D and lipocalin family protein